MANELQWRGFLTVEARDWFSADTRAEHESYVANVALVEQQRAEVDAERAAIAAIPLASGANRGEELKNLPARSAALGVKRLQAIHAEISARFTFDALVASMSKDAGAEATRLEAELRATEAALAAWFETGPTPEIGGFVAPVDAGGQILPQVGSWTVEFQRRHPRVLALRAAIDNCVLSWAGDFLRINAADAEQARQQLEAGHAALLAV